jgi:hypothetical protein
MAAPASPVHTHYARLSMRQDDIAAETSPPFFIQACGGVAASIFGTSASRLVGRRLRAIAMESKPDDIARLESAAHTVSKASSEAGAYPTPTAAFLTITRPNGQAPITVRMCLPASSGPLNSTPNLELRGPPQLKVTIFLAQEVHPSLRAGAVVYEDLGQAGPDQKGGKQQRRCDPNQARVGAEMDHQHDEIFVGKSTSDDDAAKDSIDGLRRRFDDVSNLALEVVEESRAFGDCID